MEINQVFIAAILTVIGYSLNDTVVFLTELEYTRNNQNEKSLDCKFSLNSTLSRTLNTL